MTVHGRILTLLSASLFVTTFAVAATPEPPPSTRPAFAGPIQCAADSIKAEFSCKGGLVGLGADPVLIRVQVLGQCQTRDGTAPVLTLQGENPDLKTTSGALTFDKLATKPPDAKDCPATQEIDFASQGLMTVEQPAKTIILQGTGIVFPLH